MRRRIQPRTEHLSLSRRAGLHDGVSGKGYQIFGRGMPVQSSASSSKAKGAVANFEVRMAAPALQEDLPETIRKGS